MKSHTSYLSPSRPHVFAHRGYCGLGAVENTYDAFAAAIAAGATHVETDVQATSDGVVVHFHDDDLLRLCGDPRSVSEISWAELQHVRYENGSGFALFEETLRRFPDTRFNIDLKFANAVHPAVDLIRKAGAADRVLVASFSSSNRLRALSELGVAVSSSADSSLLLRLWLMSVIGSFSGFDRLCESIDALQLPVRFGPLSFTGKRFIAFAHRAGLTIHYWTINDVDEMRRLVALGADGVVTDDAALAVKTLRERLS